MTQTVILPQSRDALFITLGFKEGGEQAALEVLSSLSSLTNGVGFRYPQAHLSAVAGVGAKMWDRLFALEKPEHLHEFVELTGAKHHAPSTPGDVFFHIRADEFDVPSSWRAASTRSLRTRSTTTTRSTRSSTRISATRSVSSTARKAPAAKRASRWRSSAAESGRAAATSSSRSTCTT